MYNDDMDVVETVRRFAEVREQLTELKHEEEQLRAQVNCWLDQAKDNLLETDEFRILRIKRSAIKIDRRQLEADFPDAFRACGEMSVVGTLKVMPR